VTRFRNLSIRYKLLVLTLTSTASALVLAAGGFVVWDIAEFRSAVRQDVLAQSVMVAENSGASLTFGDDQVAREILSVLRVRPRMEMACLYRQNGVLFTSYHRDPNAACPSPPPGRSFFGWEAFDVVAPVTVNSEQIGTLYTRRELGDLYARLRVGTATVLSLLVLAFGVSLLTSARMQRSIASPLLELADTARTISDTRNYALRATSASQDEVGTVMHAFNEMLDRIAEALERERAANRLKDEFLATLSHELRTPLNAVLGWTRLLRSSRLEEGAQSRALEAIERNARAQVRLIEDLLDMSAIVRGKPRLNIRETDLAAIVDAALDVVRPAAVAKRLALHIDIAVRPAMTHGDSSRLQQAVWNLLSNAVKFTPPDGEVWVRLERDHDYRLTVRDSGPGIDPSFLPLVFEPFRQADGTLTREHGGLGLGLAIAKQWVELHGGVIHARSPGRGYGATFEIFLPSVIAKSTQSVTHDSGIAPLPAMPVDRALLRGLHVLVVDDDEDARALLETALTRFGARVDVASGVAEAWTALERRRPDVLLSDIGMPTEDGYALIRQLRTRPPSVGGDIPAVAVTAYASADDEAAAVAAGYQAHIAKPIDPAHVARIVATLGRRSPAGQHR
jgi:signal transduction histidine kinase/ActR/RegA family two-component response regulator